MSSLANIGRQFLLKSGSQIVSLLTIMYFTRILSPEQLGQYFYFESLLGMVAIFAGFGISGATEKYVSEKSDRSLWFSSGLFLIICTSIAISALFIIFNSKVHEILSSQYLLLFIIALVSTRLYSIYQHLLRAELRAATAGSIDLARFVVIFAISFLLVKYGLGSTGLILGYILSHVLLLPISVFISKTSVTIPRFQEGRELIHFAKYYAINVLGSKIFYLADVVIIGILLTKADVGRYEIAWRLIFAGMMLNSIISNTVFSYISKSYGENDTKGITSEIGQSLRYILLIPFATAAGAFFIGQEVISLLFTADYTTPRLVITILGVGFIFQAIFSLFSRSLIAIDKPKMAFYATTAAITVNLVMNLLFIPIFGSLGAATATAVSYAFAAVIYYFTLRRYVKISFSWTRLKIQSSAAILMAIGLASTIKWMGKSSDILVIVYLLGGGAIYIVLLLSSHKIRYDIIKLLRETRY
ncbi:flippase [Halostella sp. JP-L12]|uniref:flippase n=1 Tax=Halostella TaxID=1843185 RepID=UPI000EF78EE1|nr:MULTISPECIES: flippase [Halostella]NHN46478.1 flippase [Halostella sp. JP-L12]